MKKKVKRLMRKALIAKNNAGKVGMPILMYMLGVPGVVCIFAWLFFFKNK
jgi:hypothetical protein